MNTPNDGFDTVHEKTGNGGTKPVSFASIYMDDTPKMTVQLSELSNEETVEGADVAIPLASVDELGRPIMLDAYASTMCLKSWGRNTYARGLIEVSSKKALVDSLVVAIPFQNWSGHFMETIDIGYECQPPRCSAVRKLRLLLRLENRMMGLWSVNGKASTSQPKENKEAASQSNVFSALEKDNGNPMDDLVDETRKKVEVPPKKTPRKTGIWSGRKVESPKRNVVFSSETNVHYFDRDDMEFDDMGQAAEGWKHENAYIDNG
ncbi:hypothetical protein Tco_1561996 [Tanacetum coccineum]